MNARDFLIEEICKYNLEMDKEHVEKVLSKYSVEDIERLVDALIRFGTDNIFEIIGFKK